MAVAKILIEKNEFTNEWHLDIHYDERYKKSYYGAFTTLVETINFLKKHKDLLS